MKQGRQFRPAGLGMEFTVSLRWDEAEATEIVRRHEGREGRLLPILHELQAAFGSVPEPAISFLAAALNITRAEVHGVVSFYHDFRREPAGRHVLDPLLQDLVQPPQHLLPVQARLIALEQPRRLEHL